MSRLVVESCGYRVELVLGEGLHVGCSGWVLAQAAGAVVSISDLLRSAASTAFRVRASVARLVGEQIGAVVV